MEFNYLTASVMQFCIGDFYLSCYRKREKTPDVGSVQIPFAGMAFYHPEVLESDFCFQVGNAAEEDNFSRIYGSDSFMEPLFIRQNPEGEYIWIRESKKGDSALKIRISRDWTQFTLYEDHTGTNGERAFHELGSLFSYAVLNRHACVLHGVVMEYQGRGILVLARAGTGKTTHTRMWRDRKNALIINGDRCLCRKQDGVWYAYGMPWSGSSGEYINRRVPVSCIINLNRGEENTVKPLPLYDRTICLMQRIFAPAWPGELQTRAFDLCDELAAEIPMLDFYCRPDPESVDVLEKAVMRYGKS